MLGVDTVPPGPDLLQPHGPRRVRPGRHPQPADRQGDRAGGRRHGGARRALARPVGDVGVGGDEGDERPRHHAAARRLPEGADGAAGRARVDHRGLRREPAGPGAVRRDDDAERPPDRRVRPRRRRDRGLPARLRPAAAGRLHHRAALRQPGRPADRHRGHPLLRAAGGAHRPRLRRPRCSCCTRRTRSPCSNARWRTTLPGVVNVAADGVLLLSQAIRRAGRVPLPVPPPAVGPVGRALAAARVASFSPEQLRLLDFGRVVDTTRLRTAFGFTPRWTTVAGLRRLRARPRAPPAGSGASGWRRPSGWSTAGCTRPPGWSPGSGGGHDRRRPGRPRRHRPRRRPGHPAARRRRRAGSGPPGAQPPPCRTPPGDPPARSRAGHRTRCRAPESAPYRHGRTPQPARPATAACRSPRPESRRPCRTRRAPARLGGRRSPTRSRSCAAGSPATTPSTSSASTPTSPTTSSSRCCGRCTGRGSGSRPPACTTFRTRAARWSSPTTPAPFRSTR